MAGTTNSSFEFLKTVQSKCPDFCEFDQSAYIKEGLHDSEVGKSVHSEGVCAALGVYVISDWINNSTRKDLVDRLIMDCNPLNTSRPSLEPVNDMAHGLEEGNAREKVLEYIQTKTTKTPDSSGFEVNPSQAIEQTTSLGPCFMAWGGLVKTGHAIICDGKSRVVFDPNYGYFQSKDSDDEYFWLFKKIIAKYPSYSKSTAISLYAFS